MDHPTIAQRFRKRPLEVDAVDVRRAFYCVQRAWAWASLPDWLVAAYEDGKVLYLTEPARVEIHTLEGVMTAGIDDWIVRGVQGELYPVKPDVFAATYEPVEADR